MPIILAQLPACTEITTMLGHELCWFGPACSAACELIVGMNPGFKGIFSVTFPWSIYIIFTGLIYGQPEDFFSHQEKLVFCCHSHLLWGTCALCLDHTKLLQAAASSSIYLMLRGTFIMLKLVPRLFATSGQQLPDLDKVHCKLQEVTIQLLIICSNITTKLHSLHLDQFYFDRGFVDLGLLLRVCPRVFSYPASITQ